MFDRIRAFFRTMPGQEVADDDDPRVAAAALLFHLMDADGIRDRDETVQLPELISESFDIDGTELDRIVAAGEKAEGEAIDLHGFTRVLNRHLDHETKLDLIGSMWELVFADGELHELEDNIVWRIAELLHVERDDRVAMRKQARDAVGLPGRTG